MNNDYWKGKKKDHEWGVVAQIWKPKYREFWHCPLCSELPPIEIKMSV